MDNAIKQILDLFFQVVDRLGTKCAVAIATLIALGYSVYAAIVPPLVGVPAIVVVAIGYFWFDYKHKLKIPPLLKVPPMIHDEILDKLGGKR